MGLGFRKSMKILPGVRLNLSRRGAGVSAGPLLDAANSLTERRVKEHLSASGVLSTRSDSR